MKHLRKRFVQCSVDLGFAMLKSRVLSTFVAVALAVLATGPAFANYFDCSVVYDEFDQLMLGEFLVEPDRYVPTLTSLMARSEHLEYQIEQFKLRKDRKNNGIGIFHTNRNTRGKMIFVWQENSWDDRIPLVIEEVITFGRVSDGYAPVLMGPVYVTPGFAVDLDTASIVEQEDETADITYDIEGGDYVIRAIIPAQVHFPVQSMCVKIE